MQAGGADRRHGDDLGGHLIATIFGGSGLVDNIVAMNYNLNRGKYKSLENMWASILEADPTAKINVNISLSICSSFLWNFKGFLGVLWPN